ncbi:CYTH domain-containing protein [Marinoscillum sp.]|uniref:CYTH domain-containing protein n=1 Tax=Marinoscillum sp. TaxID=2024838 RepID=UPI003BAD90A9
MTYKDITLKARIDNPRELQRLLQDLAEYKGLDHQVDTYFETTEGKLKWRQGTIENAIMHYERHQENGVERTTVYRYDQNPTRQAIDELKATQKAIGQIKKRRHIYFQNHLKIHLDQLPTGEHFLEIEAIDQSGMLSDELLLKECLNLKEQLRINDAQLIATGYFKNL